MIEMIGTKLCENTFKATPVSFRCCHERESIQTEKIKAKSVSECVRSHLVKLTLTRPGKLLGSGRDRDSTTLVVPPTTTTTQPVKFLSFTIQIQIIS